MNKIIESFVVEVIKSLIRKNIPQFHWEGNQRQPSLDLFPKIYDKNYGQ